jgi:hypothetical protein
MGNLKGECVMATELKRKPEEDQVEVREFKQRVVDDGSDGEEQTSEFEGPIFIPGGESPHQSMQNMVRQIVMQAMMDEYKALLAAWLKVQDESFQLQLQMKTLQAQINVIDMGFHMVIGNELAEAEMQEIVPEPMDCSSDGETEDDDATDTIELASESTEDLTKSETAKSSGVQTGGLFALPASPKLSPAKPADAVQPAAPVAETAELPSSPSFATQAVVKVTRNIM